MSFKASPTYFTVQVHVMQHTVFQRLFYPSVRPFDKRVLCGNTLVEESLL